MSDSLPLIAAVDQGSSNTKAAAVAADGRRHREFSIPIATRSDGASVQHDPEAIAASVERVLDHVLDTHSVAAIGLTCQRSTCLLWDRESGEPLTPALSWQDTSQRGRAKSLARHSRLIHETTGLRLSPHYAAAKLAALLETVPNGRRRAEHGELVAGTLDAFLARRLTGMDGTEPGHAGRTLLYDLEAGAWSDWLADLFGIPLSALPPLRSSAGGLGEYRGVPVTAIAGDQQAALLGHGGWHGGTSAVHFGTGAFVLAATGDRPLRHPSALTAVLASTPEHTVYQVEGTVNSAGSAVEWAARLSGESLDRWRRRSLDPQELPFVLPAFRGVGTPWWRPDARAAVAGLEIDSSASDLLAGTLGGVAMRVLDCVELLDSLAPVRVLRASGKLTRLDGLIQLLADAGQIPVERAVDEEVGLLGIAHLALAGLTGNEDPLELAPPSTGRHEPRWSAKRARATRDSWRAFVESIVGASGPLA